ncbi:hypothetical protein SAMN02745181_1341 [Rubritalea squalenifaciens DSM 18772]|uniref:Uncharacterized protein n=1 Tax=Rubritalea squalenifaciens DSM 18772 TaxID=1123071 RepID=A0A1M6H253_9BACT|nr:hypothetical protein [Rubritalea squalenifaciens]SHJ16260.1 hypothetical protein SAMN02745181_1341 [Rubritalea squalenifaciens DSM 18772]
MKGKKKKIPSISERELAELRASYEKVLKERDVATSKLEETKEAIEALKKKHGNLEHVLGDLVSGLQQEVDRRDARIHKLEDHGEEAEHDEGGDLVGAQSSYLGVGQQTPEQAFQDLLAESGLVRSRGEGARSLGDTWEDEEDEVRGSSGMKWLLILGGVAVLGVGVAAAQLWLGEGGKESDNSNVSGAVFGDASGEEIERLIEEQLKASKNRAETVQKLFKSFFEEQDLEAKSAMCVNPRRTMQHMRDLVDRGVAAIPAETEIEELKVAENQIILPDGNKAWKVSLRLQGETDQRVTYVYELEDGELMIDWETFVRYQSIPWEEFIDAKPSGVHEMHVLVGTGGDESSEYPLGKYFGVRLRGWDHGAARWVQAYMPRDHPDAASFTSKLSNLSESADAYGLPYQYAHYVLRVRYSSDEQNSLKTLMIDSVVSDSFTYQSDLEE